MADTAINKSPTIATMNGHRMFSYSKRKLQHLDDSNTNNNNNNNDENIKKQQNRSNKPNKKKIFRNNKQRNGWNHNNINNNNNNNNKSNKFIIHPYNKDGGNDIILSSNNDTMRTRPNRARSDSKFTTKSRKILKKPRKHRLLNKPNLKPSDSDSTNTTTNYKKSYQANQRKKRLFGIDGHHRVISFKANNDININNINTQIIIPRNINDKKEEEQQQEIQEQQHKKQQVIGSKGNGKGNMQRNKSQSASPPISTNNMNISHIKTIRDNKTSSIHKFTNNHSRKRSRFESKKNSINSINIENVGESKMDNIGDPNNMERTSSSFTTDDLIPYKRGSRVLFRPSGRNDDKWMNGIIHDITEIDNTQYLSIITEFDSNNKNMNIIYNQHEPVTFAQYYIPLNDKQRVRPLYANKNNKNNKEKKKGNNTKITVTNAENKGKKQGNRASAALRLRSTRSNPSYGKSELIRLGIGGVFKDYDVKYVKINGLELIYRDNIISIPDIKQKHLDDWSSLEVCAWLLSIQNAKYSIYIPSMIENNVNGKALYQLTFVTMMKLTRYQINVTDCTKLLKSIKTLIKSIEDIITTKHEVHISNTAETPRLTASRKSQRILLSEDDHIDNNNNNKNKKESILNITNNNNNNNNNNNKIVEIKITGNKNHRNYINSNKISHNQYDSGTSSVSSVHHIDDPIEHQLNLGLFETSDDIDIPLFSNDDQNNSNQVVIEQGRFWRLFYFTKDKLVQYNVDKPVSKWTSYEVSLWIHDVYDGKFAPYSQYFIQHQIDGNSLLNITRKQATNDLKMISPNIRRLFFQELHALSTLQQCSIRQHHHLNNIHPLINNNNSYNNNSTDTKAQIRRLTQRFTQHDFNKLGSALSPKRSVSVETAENSINSINEHNEIDINTNSSKSVSISPKRAKHVEYRDNDSNNNNNHNDKKEIDEIVVAQKIVQGINKQKGSPNKVVVADLTKRSSNSSVIDFLSRNSDRIKTKTEIKHELNPLISSQEDDNAVITLHFNKLTKDQLDFYNDSNMHFIEYSDDEDVPLSKQNNKKKDKNIVKNNNKLNINNNKTDESDDNMHKYTPSVGSLFNATDPKILSDEQDIDEIITKNNAKNTVTMSSTETAPKIEENINRKTNNTKPIIMERPLSIGSVASIDNISKGTSLISDQSNTSNFSNITKPTEMTKDSRESSYNTDHTLSSSAHGKAMHLIQGKPQRGSTLLINLTTHENKTSLLVEGSVDLDNNSSISSQQQQGVSDNLHASYQQYTKQQSGSKQYGRYSNSETMNSMNSNKYIINKFDVNGEEEDIEIDIWESNDMNNNDNQQIHINNIKDELQLEMESYSPNYDDDPLFAESLSPASTVKSFNKKLMKNGIHKKIINTMSASFQFDDVDEEKMNELDENGNLIHEPNLTLDLDQPPSNHSFNTDQTEQTEQTDQTEQTEQTIETQQTINSIDIYN